MSYPPISVIIPCYNQGHFLKEALDSLKQCDPSLFETIIVNDGSTDAHTVQYLIELRDSGMNVVFQENQGLGAARNKGISLAQGEYLLPLDADNKILPDYLTKSLEILLTNNNIAAVYGNSRYFGNKTGVHRPGRYNLQRLMLGNYIDACAVMRKSAVNEVGGYDSMKIMGLEDWDLWLRLSFKGYKLFHLDEVLFEYRVVASSMLRSLNSDKQKMNSIEKYLGEKYASELDFEFVDNYFIGKMKSTPLKFFFRLILKKFFPRYYQKRVETGKFYNGWLYS